MYKEYTPGWYFLVSWPSKQTAPKLLSRRYCMKGCVVWFVFGRAMENDELNFKKQVSRSSQMIKGNLKRSNFGAKK